MSATGSHSDLPLSDALSARSYFEFGLDEMQASVHLESGPVPSNLATVSNSPTSRELIRIPGKSGPRLRPRGRQPILKESEKTETAPNAQDPLQGNDRPVRKRGRPKIETAKDAAAIEERRLQIRRAQRTYRQKKEATIQTLKTRAERLEQTLQNVSDLLNSDVDLLQARQLALAEIDKARGFPVDGYDPERRTAESLRDIFGYEILSSGRRPDNQYIEASSSKHGQSERENSRYRGYPNPRSPSPLLNRLFPSTTIYTYCYQESCLSRRLQRFCLEHTYRWLTDPNSEPPLMSRVFGLFPCIQDMPGVRRSSRRVLQSEIGGSLEVNAVAFYTLGGAGTHYPPLNENGKPVYPVNARRPGKVLRRLARILRRGGISDWDEDWSGNMEPDVGDEQGEEIRCMSQEERLRLLDLDGDWFDCHDVEGYLEYRGFVLEGSSLSLEVPATTVGALYGFSPDSGSDYCASQLYVSPSETSSNSDLSGPPNLALSGYKYTLNVECFFDLLLSNLRMLGRAPGFRVWDVDAALRAAIHRHTF